MFAQSLKKLDETPIHIDTFLRDEYLKRNDENHVNFKYKTTDEFIVFLSNYKEVYWSRNKDNELENPDLQIDKVNKNTNWLEYESLEMQRELSMLDT